MAGRNQLTVRTASWPGRRGVPCVGGGDVVAGGPAHAGQRQRLALVVGLAEHLEAPAERLAQPFGRRHLDSGLQLWGRAVERQVRREIRIAAEDPPLIMPIAGEHVAHRDVVAPGRPFAVSHHGKGETQVATTEARPSSSPSTTSLPHRTKRSSNPPDLVRSRSRRIARQAPVTASSVAVPRRGPEQRGRSGRHGLEEVLRQAAHGQHDTAVLDPPLPVDQLHARPRRFRAEGAHDAISLSHAGRWLRCRHSRTPAPRLGLAAAALLTAE